MQGVLSIRSYLTLTLFALFAGGFILACGPKNTDEKQAVDQRSGRLIEDYGSWISTISAEDVYGPSDRIGVLQSVDEALYFSLSDSENEGKVGIKRLALKGELTEAVSAQFDVKTRVHEYGGAPLLGIGNSLFAVKRDDQRLYRFAPNQEPVALTPNGTRHADCVSYPKGSRLVCVREDHRQSGTPTSSLVSLNLNFKNEGQTLISGQDFYASPRVSPDNSQLAWISWQHPNMPWDITQLWVADLTPAGDVGEPKQLLAGHSGSITQPLYSPSGELYFIADFDNWWNIYRITAEGTLEKVLQESAEFAVPDWMMGNHNYAFESEDTIIASYKSKGKTELVRIDLDSGLVSTIAAEFADVRQVIKGSDGVYFVGNKATPEKGIYRVKGRGVELVYAPQLPVVDPNYIARAQTISFTSATCDTPVHGYYYGPRNPNYLSPSDQRPPLLLMMHGGPTASASLSFRRDIQFWTSRGFAVLDLNYRGSSGFGRDYRRSLYGLWGQADVEDAVQAANYLVERGWVDGKKLAIRGSSAGGFTVLSALAFYDTFSAGVVYSGISDLDSLDKLTHKFEQGYLDQLVGDLKPGSSVYRDRSPLYHLEQLTEPLLLIRGLDDPDQSLSIFYTLKSRGVPSALLSYEDEGHGLQKPANQIAALEAELSFYGQVFGFKPAGNIQMLTLDNSEHLPVMDPQVR